MYSLKMNKEIIHLRRRQIFIVFDPQAMGPFIYNIITFFGFLDPPPPLRQHVLVVRISKNGYFLTPLPPTSADVIYEWSLRVHTVVCILVRTASFPRF